MATDTHNNKSGKKSIKFTEDVSLDPHCIQCVLMTSNHYQVDLGLLSSLNTYEINFDMKHDLGDEVDMPPLQSPVVDVMALDKIDGGHHITLQVKCSEESEMNEQILFENSNNKNLTLNLTSRIMLNHLGTPALKSGVKLIQSAPDTMSDATDWQGFD